MLSARSLANQGHVKEALDLLREIRVRATNEDLPLVLAEEAWLELMYNKSCGTAQEIVDQALSESTHLNLQVETLYCLATQAAVMIECGRVDEGLGQANETYDKIGALGQTEVIPSGGVLAFLLGFVEYLVGRALFRKGNPHLALEFVTQATSHLRETEALNFLVRSYILQGVCERILGRSDRTIALFQEAENVARNHMPVMLPIIFNNLGEVLLVVGEYVQAERYLRRGWQVALDMDDREMESVLLTNLGELFLLQGDNTPALDYNHRALRLHRRYGNYAGQVYTLNSLGQVHRRLGEYETSRLYFDEALRLVDQHTSASQHLPTVATNYARTLLASPEIVSPDEAFELLLRAKSSVAVRGQETEMPVLLNTEGLYYKAVGKNALAQAKFLEAYNHARKQNNYINIVESAMFLTEGYLELYKRSGKKFQFKIAQNYVEEALKLAEAKRQSTVPLLVRIRVLKAVLDAAELNFGHALNELKQATADARSKDLKAELEDINRLGQQIKAQLPQTPTDVGVALSIISKFTERSEVRLQSSDVGLVVFRFTNMGPTPHFVSDNLKERNKTTVTAIANVGVVLSMMIGQGHGLFSGLYGPIPVSQFPDSLVLCYAALVNDKHSPDERMRGTNYILLSVLYPKIAQDYLLYNRVHLQEVFQEYLEHHPEFSDWQDIMLEQLYTKIIECFDIGEP